MSYKAEKVFLVDDEETSNFLSEYIIKESHFAPEIIKYSSGKQALGALSDGEQPDCIFLDIRMPEMGGFEFLEEYYKQGLNNSKTKVIMLSSSIYSEDKQRAFNFDCVVHYISKPLTMGALMNLSV
jgi:CheY-like chemotaxis protein